MDTPINTLPQRLEIGDVALSELFPFLIEQGTDPINDEIPRILFRLFLPSRLSEGEKFTLKSLNWTGWNIDDVKSNLGTLDTIPSSLTYITVGQYKTLKTPIKTALTKNGFVVHDMMNKFFEMQNKEDDGKFVLTFYKEDTKSVVVVSSYTSNYYHNIAVACMAKTMPWYFKDKPLNEDEAQLVLSISKGSDIFMAIANKLYDLTNIASKVMETKLKAAFKGTRERLIKNAESNINSIKNTFDSLQRQFEDALKRLREEEIKRDSLLASEDEYDAGLIDYLTANKNISVMGWVGNALRFVTGANLQLYNQDDADKIDRKDSHFYWNSPADDDHEWRKKLLEYVFVENIIKVPVYTVFDLDIGNSSIRRAPSDITPSGTKFENYVPQPHHYGFNCFGNNLGKAMEYIKNGNYVAAIDQAVGSIRTWNYGDDAVTRDMTSKYFWNTGRKCFKLPDGSMVNYIDAIEWLKKEEENENG